MTAHDELVRRLVAERFTRHERHVETDEEKDAREAWKRLKSLQEAARPTTENHRKGA